jgi:hypothetical protein
MLNDYPRFRYVLAGFCMLVAIIVVVGFVAAVVLY